jgi:hypothetical protein
VILYSLQQPLLRHLAIPSARACGRLAVLPRSPVPLESEAAAVGAEPFCRLNSGEPAQNQGCAGESTCDLPSIDFIVEGTVLDELPEHT